MTTYQINTDANPAYLDIESSGPSSSLNVTALQTSGTYNANLNDLVRTDPSGEGVTVNLPAASAGTGWIVVKVQGDTNVLTSVVPNGADTIDGQATNMTIYGRERLWLFSDGVSDWMVLAQ